MIDADINDISIEIPDESKTIEKPDGTPSTSGEKSIQRRKTSNTAMDIYSELKSKREEELLKIIDEKISKITVLEQKIISLEEAQKETSDKEQERKTGGERQTERDGPEFKDPPDAITKPSDQ